MTLQAAALAFFTAWLVVGVALGAWLGPLRPIFGAGAFHVQSLYDTHEPMRAAAVPEEPSRIRLAWRMP